MKQAPGRSGLRVLRKEQLLPLPPKKVQALSLEHHMALVTVRSGHGSHDQVVGLLRVIYLAFYLRNETAACVDVGLYRQAEKALDACIARAERGEKWLLLDREAAVIERLLVVHDAQLAAVPMYRYASAWERLARFIVDSKQSRSPIPVNDAASGTPQNTERKHT